jgi:hypothetical protein
MSTVMSDANSIRNLQATNAAAQMTNPFDIPSNHRLLAAESALKCLYGETGMMGVTAKKRYEAVNAFLISQGKASVSEDTIRRAVRRLRNHNGAEK